MTVFETDLPVVYLESAEKGLSDDDRKTLVQESMRPVRSGTVQGGSCGMSGRRPPILALAVKLGGRQPIVSAVEHRAVSASALAPSCRLDDAGRGSAQYCRS